MIDSDLEIYILEAKEKNKELKKVSVLEPYKDIIFEMLNNGLNKKQVYNYLVLKYDVDTSYYNLTKWCKRHFKDKNQKINQEKDVVTVEPNTDKANKVLEAKKRYKERPVI